MVCRGVGESRNATDTVYEKSGSFTERFGENYVLVGQHVQREVDELELFCMVV